MKRKAVVIPILSLLLVLFVKPTSPSQAQQKPAPLIFSSAGDLWSITGPNDTPRQLTTWGFNDNPILSPDDQQVAYTSKATIFVNVWKKTGGFGGSDFPTNIWVMDIATGDAVRIADQP